MRLAPGLVPLVLALAHAAAAAVGAVPDLEGTWHVLVHYTDGHADDPEALRWDDRVWVIEREGDRLRWTEYPIVVFEDESGRFEALGGAQPHRAVHAWEPNEGQREQIARGLEVNPRGRLSKTLRHTEEGWISGSQARPASASALTYVQTWRIRGTPELPIFEREDVLSSARSDSLEGVTRYTTTAVRAGGDVLRGTFERDDSLHGSFRLLRAGPVSDVSGSGKSQSERAVEAWWSEPGADAADDEPGSDPAPADARPDRPD